MNADGSGLTRLTYNRFEDVEPAWSSDGATIAFTSRRHGNTDIYLMAQDGSDQERLTHSAAGDGNPDWSPDGTRLVFQSNRRDRNWDLYTIRPDGSGLEQLTSDPTIEATPAWSPEGRQIAFTIARYSHDREDIAVLHLDSSVLVRFVIRDSFELEPDWQPVLSTSVT